MIGGALPSDGQVEIWYSNTWRTVCASLWRMSERNVVCRQLGYRGALTQTRNFNFSKDDSFILPIQRLCLGDETNILECVTQDTSNECFAAGVTCSDVAGKLIIFLHLCE